MVALQFNHQKSYATPILSFGRKNIIDSIASSKIIYVLQTHKREDSLWADMQGLPVPIVEGQSTHGLRHGVLPSVQERRGNEDTPTFALFYKK